MAFEHSNSVIIPVLLFFDSWHQDQPEEKKVVDKVQSLELSTTLETQRAQQVEIAIKLLHRKFKMPDLDSRQQAVSHLQILVLQAGSAR